MVPATTLPESLFSPIRPGEPLGTFRKVQLLGWVGPETKTLEAVRVLTADSVAFCWQVTLGGREILQTLDLSEAQNRYDRLT